MIIDINTLLFIRRLFQVNYSLHYCFVLFNAVCHCYTLNQCVMKSLSLPLLSAVPF